MHEKSGLGVSENWREHVRVQVLAPHLQVHGLLGTSENQ